MMVNKLKQEVNTFPDGVYEISGLYNWDEDMNDPHFEMLINEFVNQQDFFSINPNGKIERIVIINEFNKFCYINKYSCSLKRDEIIEMVKDEYWKRHETKLSKQEFFESLKPQKFKYKW